MQITNPVTAGLMSAMPFSPLERILWTTFNTAPAITTHNNCPHFRFQVV